MNERCPVCGTELRRNAYGWVCPNVGCPVDQLTENDIALARATREAADAEARRPWREALGRLFSIMPDSVELDYDRLEDKWQHDEAMDAARALLAKAGE